MVLFCRRGWLAFVVVAALVPATALAGERRSKAKSGAYNPDDQTVEMFKAIDAGQIEVCDLVAVEEAGMAAVFGGREVCPGQCEAAEGEGFVAADLIAKVGGIDADRFVEVAGVEYRRHGFRREPPVRREVEVAGFGCPPPELMLSRFSAREDPR